MTTDDVVCSWDSKGDPVAELRDRVQYTESLMDTGLLRRTLDDIGVAVVEHITNPETGEKSVRLVDPSRVRFNCATGFYEVDGIPLNSTTEENRWL